MKPAQSGLPSGSLPGGLRPVMARHKVFILDEAEQKGTGRWTVKSALDLGVPVTGIAEAVFARALSGSVAQRKATTGLASGDLGEKPSDAAQFIDDVSKALYASKIIAYAQGFNQIQAGSADA